MVEQVKKGNHLERELEFLNWDPSSTKEHFNEGVIKLDGELYFVTLKVKDKSEPVDDRIRAMFHGYNEHINSLKGTAKTDALNREFRFYIERAPHRGPSRITSTIPGSANFHLRMYGAYDNGPNVDLETVEWMKGRKGLLRKKKKDTVLKVNRNHLNGFKIIRDKSENSHTSVLDPTEKEDSLKSGGMPSTLSDSDREGSDRLSSGRDSSEFYSLPDSESSTTSVARGDDGSSRSSSGPPSVGSSAGEGKDYNPLEVARSVAKLRTTSSVSSDLKISSIPEEEKTPWESLVELLNKDIISSFLEKFDLEKTKKEAWEKLKQFQRAIVLDEHKDIVVGLANQLIDHEHNRKELYHILDQSIKGIIDGKQNIINEIEQQKINYIVSSKRKCTREKAVRILNSGYDKGLKKNKLANSYRIQAEASVPDEMVDKKHDLEKLEVLLTYAQEYFIEVQILDLMKQIRIDHTDQAVNEKHIDELFSLIGCQSDEKQLSKKQKNDIVNMIYRAIRKMDGVPKKPQSKVLLKETSKDYNQIKYLKTLMNQGNLSDIIQIINSVSFDINSTDQMGNTLLHIALLLNNTPIIRILLSNEKIDINKKNKSGDTPLDFAKLAEDIALAKGDVTSLEKCTGIVNTLEQEYKAVEGDKINPENDKSSVLVLTPEQMKEQIIELKNAGQNKEVIKERLTRTYVYFDRTKLARLVDEVFTT